ncbi:MAG: aspartate aminotransferase family protein [Nitrospinota bacterium]|nr:aspartate aminotransferase family protein [Nitrospinota bacterium]
MGNKEIIDTANSFLTPNYSRQPFALVKGKGVFVWDADGKKYLDFASGVAVNNLGHCNAAVNKAVSKQLIKLGHTSNLYYTDVQTAFAKALVEKIYPGKIFFCNSGTEAVEAALKLARLHFAEKEEKNKTEVIAFERAFHGRTMGALSLTYNKKYKTGFGPMLPGVKHVPFGDLEAVTKAISPKTCAVIIEPVQGEGGVYLPKPGFIQKLAKLCASKHIILIFDEVQTGFGRTGKLFAYEHFGVKPDIITMAKSMASGFPMGAMFAQTELAKSLQPGTHASTFGGGAAACAAASATLEILSKPETLDHVQNIGRYMLIKLTDMKASHKPIREVRGLGLMVGIELAIPGSPIVRKCAEMGLLINCVNDSTLRLMPPLIVKKPEVDKALTVLGKALAK